MEFRIIFLNARKITIELINQGIYYADKEYSIFLDGKEVMTSKKIVQTIEGLKPDTEYKLQVKNADEMSEEVTFKTEYEFVTLNVKAFGAKGDGIQDDTLFIQAAINACPKNSRVYLPKGVYKVVSLFLKSDITIDLDKDAVISAYTDYHKFPILPGLIESYDEKDEYNLGTWEGNPLDMFTSIITGIGVSNVVITGSGVIDGSATHDDWWIGTGRLKIGGVAFRPRMIYLNGCENITVQGLTVQNSPAWNIHPYFSDNTRWIDMQIINPKISPNTDGIDPESVNGMDIIGVYFSLGDDCIAIKSGKYYMGHKYKKASENIEIRQCYMRHGHGSVTLGSEQSAGVKNIVVRDCIFDDTDRGLRVKTRRGRGKDAVIDNITFENIRMDGVLTPFVVNCYYWCCDPDGHSEYVRSKEPLPVDDRTPFIKNLSFKNIDAKNCHVAASFIYGLPEAKIEEAVFENIKIDFAENPTPEYPAMMADVEPCTRKGIYINNVAHLVMKNIEVKGVEGEAIIVENIDNFEKDW